MSDVPETEPTSKPLPPPWDRIFSLGSRLVVWGILFGILYILRPFFLLVFLTFVFAYILEHGVQGLQHRLSNRPLRVVIVATLFLGTLITIGTLLAPAFARQAQELARRYPDYLTSIDNELNKLRANYKWTRSVLPENLQAVDLVEHLIGFVRMPAEEVEPTRAQPANDWRRAGGSSPIGRVYAQVPGMYREPVDLPRSNDADDRARENDNSGTNGSTSSGGRDPEDREREIDPTDTEIAGIKDAAAVTNQDPELAEPLPPPLPNQDASSDPIVIARSAASRQRLESAMDLLKDIASPILGIGSAFLLSLLFSFLIVLDLPRLSRSVAGLSSTRIAFIYDAVGANLRDFGLLLGRALEAQVFIAICNTILTAIGLYFLDLTENLIFLSTIVFFCSFIPVAGVFISSVPICLEALSESGAQLMLFAVIMILVVHFLEAYFLNPKIFGHHLHMNAVMVLIVLIVGGKLVGMWGLILGLPLVNYVFTHAIRHRREDPPKPRGAAI